MKATLRNGKVINLKECSKNCIGQKCKHWDYFIINNAEEFCTREDEKCIYEKEVKK